MHEKDVGVVIKKGAITENTEYTIGMALFLMKGPEKSLKGVHVAIYVGDYFEGHTNAVIESVASGVFIRSLDESERINGSFTHFGYFMGLGY